MPFIDSGFNCCIGYNKLSDNDVTKIHLLNDFQDRGMVGHECSTTNTELVHKSEYFTDLDFIKDINDVTLTAVEWDYGIPSEHKDLRIHNFGYNNSNHTFEIFLSWR